MTFYNPLFDSKEVASVSATDKPVQSESGAFHIDNPDVCPKCSSATCSTQLLSGEAVKFCTNCRVSMAIPLK
ncbi:DNA ligase [Yersinia phage fHe-Yen9-02]|nr:DNA ligase [Yersinia phage fHe-Yen9-02]